MTTHHDDDREFDAFLRGEDDLSSLLRQAPQPEVPPELDARILAQARAALGEGAHAGREAANDPAPAPWLMRMRVPLGLAATVVIGVSLSLRWTGWQEGTPVVLVSDSEPAASAAPPPAVAAKPEAAAEAPAPRGEDGSGVATPGVATPDAAATIPAAPPVRTRAVPAPAPAAAAPAEEEVRPPPPPPPPAPAPPAPPAPAPMALRAPAPAAPSVFYRAAPPAPAAPAPAAPAPAPAPPAPALQAAPKASTHVEVTGSRIARSDQAAAEPRAEQWLSLLTELLDRHLDDDARDNWARFRREFPDYPVPPSLQARIDALQRTQ